MVYTLCAPRTVLIVKWSICQAFMLIAVLLKPEKSFKIIGILTSV